MQRLRAFMISDFWHRTLSRCCRDPICGAEIPRYCSVHDYAEIYAILASCLSLQIGIIFTLVRASSASSDRPGMLGWVRFRILIAEKDRGYGLRYARSGNLSCWISDWAGVVRRRSYLMAPKEAARKTWMYNLLLSA